MNLVNARKEFFHVEFAELEAFAKQRGLAMAFTKIAERRSVTARKRSRETAETGLRRRFRRG